MYRFDAEIISSGTSTFSPIECKKDWIYFYKTDNNKYGVLKIDKIQPNKITFSFKTFGDNDLPYGNITKNDTENLSENETFDLDEDGDIDFKIIKAGNELKLQPNNGTIFYDYGKDP